MNEVLSFEPHEDRNTDIPPAIDKPEVSSDQSKKMLVEWLASRGDVASIPGMPLPPDQFRN